jgi:cellulose biosynthesis protein BcsQ
MTGVDLLSLPDVPLEALFRSAQQARERLQDLVRKASQGYTYVFIDLPDGTGDVTGAALRVADVALVPLPSEEESLSDAERMVRALDDLRHRENLPLRIALLLTMVSAARDSARVTAALRSGYSRYMLPTGIPLDDTLQRRLDGLPAGRIPSSGEEAYHQVAIDLSRRLSSLSQPAQANAG